MKPDIKKKWLQALRSGRYDQGEGLLCDNIGDDQDPDYRWCCLGVLINETVGFDHLPGDDRPVSYFNSHPKYTFAAMDDAKGNINEAFPPNWLLREWGLSQRAAEFLTSMNDGAADTWRGKRYEMTGFQGHSFEWIADWIEEHL